MLVSAPESTSSEIFIVLAEISDSFVMLESVSESVLADRRRSNRSTMSLKNVLKLLLRDVDVVKVRRIDDARLRHDSRACA